MTSSGGIMNALQADDDRSLDPRLSVAWHQLAHRTPAVMLGGFAVAGILGAYALRLLPGTFALAPLMVCVLGTFGLVGLAMRAESAAPVGRERTMWRRVR